MKLRKLQIEKHQVRYLQKEAEKKTNKRLPAVCFLVVAVLNKKYTSKKIFVNPEMSTFKVMTVDMLGKDVIYAQRVTRN